MMESLVGISKGLVSGLRSTRQGANDGFSGLNGEWHNLLPETRQWLRQLTTYPSYFYANNVDILIRTLIADNNWQYLDRMWIFATEQRQHAQVSIVNPNGIYTAWPTNISEQTNGGTLIWSTNQGYLGDGSKSYLNTNYNPSSQGINFTLNNNSSGVYSITNSISGNEYDIGTYDGTYLNAMSIANTSSNLIVYNNASSNGGTAGSSITDSLSLVSQFRINSTTALVYKRATSIPLTVGAGTAVHVPNYPFYLLAINNQNTSVINNSVRRLSVAYIGSANIKITTFYNAIQTFATTIGFNV